jgi:hypothetical protein
LEETFLPRHYVFLFVLVAAGCSSSFQGIRVRAQYPAVEEAFNKLSQAVVVDDYAVLSVDPQALLVETDWRPAKENEKSEADKKIKEGTMDTKVSIKLQRRGMLYDVLITPTLRYSGNGSEQLRVADIHHPLRAKWERVVNTFIRKEAKEED